MAQNDRTPFLGLTFSQLFAPFLVLSLAPWGLGCSGASPDDSGEANTGGGANLGSGGSQLGTGGQTPSGGTAGTGGALGSGGTSGGTGGEITSGGSDSGGSGSGGEATGGSGGSTTITSASPLQNRYDGARETTVSFDDDWLFVLGDPAGAEATAFDDGGWTLLDVPHDWSITLPYNENSAAGPGGGYLDGGVGWYRKEFTLPAESAGKKVFVQFDGVYMDSTVWLNGQEICGRPYGYSSFECDLSAHAEFGADNVLAVRVNNELPSSRWYSGSGIYRHTWLKTVDPLRVAYMGSQVTTPEVSSESATVVASLVVQNDSAVEQEVSVQSVILDAEGIEVASSDSAPVTLAAGATSTIEQTLSLSSPALWSLESPKMYSLVSRVASGDSVVDTYRTLFGVRTFALDANTGFSLNGEHMKLQGVCLHHDLGALGAAVNTRAMEKRFELLKEMGVNAVRTSHNPPAPELLDLADSMGLLVMVEAFDTWGYAKMQYDYGRYFGEWSDTDIADLVVRDRNHPSVIMWSIGNEVAESDRTDIAERLMGVVRSLDDTRLIGQAFAQWSYNETTAGVEDFVGLNYNPSLYDSQHAEHPSWKLLGSETSSAVRSRGIYQKGNNQCSSYDNDIVGWGQTAENSWRDVNSRDFIAGEFIWTGFDYIGEPTPYEWPSKSSYFGAIDTANFPKDIFYFYQSRWNFDGEPMVHVVPANWTNHSPGQSVRVLVYSNAESVELFLNDQSLGAKDVDPAEGHLEWSVDFEPGALEARATSGGTVITDTVLTAGEPAALALRADRSILRADGRDLAFVEIDVVDEEGIVVPGASNSIEVTVTGPGVLLGLDGGNAVNHESYKGSSMSAFSGKLMAIIGTSDEAGTIEVAVASAGLVGTSTTLTTAK